MKRLLIPLLILAMTAGAINWEYPNELAYETRRSLNAFLNAYESACVDSISVGGVMFPMPTSIRDYWRTVAQEERTNFVAAWTALNDYILER